ncbi:MAG: thiamine pyrophosphate-dependent enzyme [Pirellulales bacterium]
MPHRLTDDAGLAVWRRWQPLLRAMLTAREIDRCEQDLVRQGRAFFHVSGAGHEASAVLAAHLTPADWLHLHYRDKALLLARGLPPEEFFLSLLCKADGHSAGRQMSAHFGCPERRVLSMVGPVGNNALQAVGVAATLVGDPERPLVVCSVGDGTTQQGEFLEAVTQAVRDQLPVLFLVEDNRWAISTPTAGRTLYDLPSGPASSFLNLPIVRLNGRDPLACDAGLAEVVATLRRTGQPALVVLEVARLSDHTNADDQNLYRDAAEIAACRAQADPITHLIDSLQAAGVPASQIEELQRGVLLEVRAAVESAEAAAEPVPCLETKAPLPDHWQDRPEYRGQDDTRTTTMREALNGVLRERIASDPRVILLGQDIEDPKGDVFGVTRGLSSGYPGRVLNSPLSESTIVGTAIGRALAGQRPVAFLQFADFLPLAFNQIASELGSMYWRSKGGWQCPVIVMITCGGYRPGLGPFHAQSLESIAAHVPGIDVFLPATAGDAAGLLNAAFESGRPTLFFYPKSCLNLVAEATSRDVATQFVPPGRARWLRQGDDLTIVSWGNPLQAAAKAADLLADYGRSVDLIDLRSLAPWDVDGVLESVTRTGRLLVVHEDNQTCGFGAEVVATVCQRVSRGIQVERVTRPDTYVPCHYASQLQILPSAEKILDAAARLLDLEISWDRPAPQADDLASISAIGSGPADAEVEVVEIRVAVGDDVVPGQVVAEVEATKGVVDVASTLSGRVREILVTPGQRVPVGAPLLHLDSPDRPRTTPDPSQLPGTVRLRPAARPVRPSLRLFPGVGTVALDTPRTAGVALLDVVGALPRRQVANEELAPWLPQWQSRDIIERTGIETRHWVSPGETVLTLAVDAARQLLERCALQLSDVDLVIGCTTTPDQITPSLASRVCAALQSPGIRGTAPAYDINAACSGYLFALRQAHDYLLNEPRGRVLIITSEVLSPLLDKSDPGTLPVFGDAATASLVVGEEWQEKCRLHFRPPLLSGHAEDGRLLAVPLPGNGPIQMRGGEVFAEAVRSMTRILAQACTAGNCSLTDLDLLVPHQANQRILDSVAHRAGRPTFSNIRRLGNTSSSTIPLALSELLPKLVTPQRWGLAAFGGGFTFAACVADARPLAQSLVRPVAA